jgi:transposase
MTRSRKTKAHPGALGAAKGGPQGPTEAGPSRGRFSAKRKREAVVRLLRGEDLDTLSREIGVTAATLSAWRDKALAAMEAALKSREPDAKDEEIDGLHAKIGQITMANELLCQKIDAMESGLPLARRRSRR